jgi:small multidrug resistance family-3 protein
MQLVKSILAFILAGFCEIGGGYLIWLWLKENKPGWYGIIEGIIFTVYGVAATLQTANFGRVYATYGGVFIVMSLLWGWKVDQTIPDRYDLVGASIALVGVAIMFYAPRN